MHRAPKLLFASTLAILLHLAVLPASASECRLNVSEAASLAGDQLSKLLGLRDLPDVADLRNEIEEPARASLRYPQSAVDDRGRALLFYVADNNFVCGFYAETSTAGDFSFISTELKSSPAELRQMVVAGVGALTQSRDAFVRAPRPRVGTDRSAAPLSPRPSQQQNSGEALRALSGALFPPDIAVRIERLSSLTILPALNIGMVPFAALDPDGNGIPMVESTSVNIEASLHALQKNVAFGWSKGQVASRPAIFGDPDATGDSEWILPRLPAAQVEAAEVATLLASKAVLGADATVMLVLKTVLDADYIHIAAHGIASDDDPIDGSFLALAAGRLTARQIQGLTLLANPLVVLSACQTGLGGTLEAGVIGLARAFIVAGAANVVASLWNVDDEATAYTMVRFVGHLTQHAPAEALRMAQIDTRKRWADPAIWAPFIVFGTRMVTQ